MPEIDYLSQAKELKEELVRIRRDIHMHPELGMEEHRTAALVEAYLQSLGLETKRVAGTGIIGIFNGGGAGKTVGLRADMDALPLSDEKKVEYASLVPGKMHACGHDAHTACLLVAAKLLTQYQATLPGHIKFFFQPAEETDGGALPMIEEGAMESPHVDAVFALHCDESIEAGQAGVTHGQTNAAADTFEVVIHGKSCHGAAPHEGIDAIVVVAQVINALQSIVSRNVDPVDSVVVTIGMLRGGYKENIIADRAELSGTIRTLSPVTREIVRERVERTIKGVAGAMGASAEVRLTRGYPCLINDRSMADLVVATGKKVLGENHVVLDSKPSLGVEDFAYFLEKAPGAFFRLGVKNEKKGIVHPAHSSLFDIDEDALPVGAAMMAQIATAYLQNSARGSMPTP